MSDDDVYERWKARVEQSRREAEAARKGREIRQTRELVAGLARLYGNRADNGEGRCRWCNILLGTDADGNRTHPEPHLCPGPEPEPCERCGQRHEWSGTAWVHACSRPPRSGGPGPATVTTLERVQTPGDGTGGAFGYRR